MWVFPSVVNGGSFYRLPLCDHSAAQLAISIWEPEPTRLAGRLSSVLQTDAALATWVAMRFPDSFRRTLDWSALATTLAHALRSLFELENAESVFLDFEQRRRRWAELAVADLTRLKDQPHRAAPILRSAADWLLSCQPDPTNVSPTLPVNWPAPDHDAAVDSGSKDHASFSATLPSPDMVRRWWMEPSESDQECSRLLPLMIGSMNRLHQLEHDYVARLEQDKLESLRQLAYGAGHEINNPLANIATRGQALLRDETDGERRRKLTTIVGQAFRAHEMITDLMLFARPPKPVVTSFDSAELVREVVAEFESDAQQRGTCTNLTAPSGIGMTADRTQIATAIKALLRNSLEALGRGGHVDVSVTLCDEKSDLPTDGSSESRWHVRRDNGRHVASPHIEITVRDSGPGIPTEVRRHMFDPFYSGRESGRGLGFGLSKCWRIVDMHAGDISVVSQEGSGTKITLRIPQHPRIT